MFSQLLSLLFTGFLLIMTVQFPDRCAEAVQNGLILCLTRAVPSLFPFFVVSALTVRSGLADCLSRLLSPFMRLYRLPAIGISALLLSFLGGYPVGAQTVSELLDSNRISEQDACRLISFCNNTGPAFLIGFCGEGLFHSLHIGLYLYCIHILSACLSGLFFRGNSLLSEPPASHPLLPLSLCLTTSVLQAGRAILSVTAFVLTFSVLLAFMTSLPTWTAIILAISQFCSLSPSAAQALLSGLIELTSGLAALQSAADTPFILLLLCSVLCAFGGVSILFQSAAAAPRLPFSRILLGKFMHAVLAAFLTMLFLPFSGL